MDAKLRVKLNEAADAALDWWEKMGSKPAKRDQSIPKPGAAHPDSESDALTRKLCHWASRRLWREGVWGKVKKDMVADSLAHVVSARRKARDRQGADEAQLSLPGFENLPKRIQDGKSWINLPNMKVPQFLAYEAKYQARAHRDQKRAEELRRLALKVERFTESDLTMAAANEQASRPATVVVMGAPRGA